MGKFIKILKWVIWIGLIPIIIGAAVLLLFFNDNTEINVPSALGVVFLVDIIVVLSAGIIAFIISVIRGIKYNKIKYILKMIFVMVIMGALYSVYRYVDGKSIADWQDILWNGIACACGYSILKYIFDYRQKDKEERK